MAEPDSDRRGWQPKHQPPRRTDFGLQLIAHRLTGGSDRQAKNSVGNEAKPKPGPGEALAPENPKPPRPPAKNLSFDLRIELEVQEAQKRLITKVDSAATTSRPVFERIINKPPPTDKLPYIGSCTQRFIRFINDWWSMVFSDPELRGLAGGCRTKPANEKYGLVYLYIIGNRVRYVGQTINPLHLRMTKRQTSGIIGYQPPIKRNLLNSFRDETLSIETEMIRRIRLDKLEQNLIRYFAPTNQLWNREHNPHFEPSNYQS